LFGSRFNGGAGHVVAIQLEPVVTATRVTAVNVLTDVFASGVVDGTFVDVVACSTVVRVECEADFTGTADC
jgi:hypothetical protein